MWIALTIFVIAYGFIASEKFPRHWVALIGGAVLLVAGVLSPLEAFHYINWETLGLLCGMFALVAILHEGGFFAWLAMRAIKAVNYHPAWLFVVLLVLVITSGKLGSTTVAQFTDNAQSCAEDRQRFQHLINFLNAKEANQP